MYVHELICMYTHIYVSIHIYLYMQMARMLAKMNKAAAAAQQAGGAPPFGGFKAGVPMGTHMYM